MSCTPQRNDIIYRAWEMPPLFPILNEGAKALLNTAIWVEKLVISRQSPLISLFPNTSPQGRWGWDTVLITPFLWSCWGITLSPGIQSCFATGLVQKDGKEKGRSFTRDTSSPGRIDIVQIWIWKCKLFFLLSALKFYPWLCLRRPTGKAAPWKHRAAASLPWKRKDASQEGGKKKKNLMKKGEAGNSTSNWEKRTEGNHSRLGISRIRPSHANRPGCNNAVKWY